MNDLVILFFVVVSLNVANIHPSCNLYHLQCYCSVCPNVYFLWNFKWGFIFICCFIFQQDLIYKPIIIIYYNWNFADGVFLYLRLLALIYEFPIHHFFYKENNVSAKHQLACNLVLKYVIHIFQWKGRCH